MNQYNKGKHILDGQQQLEVEEENDGRRGERERERKKKKKMRKSKKRETSGKGADTKGRGASGGAGPAPLSLSAPKFSNTWSTASCLFSLLLAAVRVPLCSSVSFFPCVSVGTSTKEKEKEKTKKCVVPTKWETMDRPHCENGNSTARVVPLFRPKRR